MDLNRLPKIKTKKLRRVGRGESSGKGKTSGRGAKGQKQHGKVKIGFEGGQLPIYKRLPQRRGKGNIQKNKAITITTGQLNKLPTGSTVDSGSLAKFGFLSKSTKVAKFKIVFGGKLEKKLKVTFPTSKKAKSLIEKVGGKLVNENST
jgi:large subunit ribosomal protein L15